jgi:hypothetical protein
MCNGRPTGPAPCRFLQLIPRSRDRTRRSIPRFAHESDKISKAVYQALPLCIVAALQGYAEAYATIIAYGTPTSGYWRKSALVATTACSLSQVSGKQARAVSGASSRQM